MNTKKISELTMMETVSDAANVLVEENGEAKRVPAEKMVAGSLPEHLQFGETVVGGDTLTWDGNTEGLTNVGDTVYKISEQLPVMADFANGAIVQVTTPESVDTLEIPPEQIFSPVDGIIAVAQFVTIVDENAVGKTLGEMVYSEPGLYLPHAPDLFYTSSLTIPGYTGFVTKAIKPIDKKYLPGAASCTTFYNAQEDDYIYTDKACSIKASKNDVDEALSRGIIYLCSSENTYSIIGRVSFFDGYAKLLAIDVTNGNVHAYDYYSAEHIAAGPS